MPPLQCCNKCLYCMKITAKCECTPEDKVTHHHLHHHPKISFFQAKDPVDVMYGWCHKCRAKYKEEYENLVG